MTQADRVLAALRRAGPTGITAVDFLLPNVIDGGPPITRLGARILELRQHGHPIVDGGRRQKCAIYQLDKSSSVGPARSERAPLVAEPGPTEDSPALFDLPAARKPLSPYDAEAA